MYLLTETVSPFALERWAAFFANFGQFAKGFLYTLGISIGALIVALLLGLIFGAMSSTRNKVLRGISRVYVEIFQNTPLLVQFVVVFYGISILTDGNVMIPTSLTAILCVGVYTGAYISEIVRAGIEAVPKGQLEAAYSLGIRPVNAMRYVILPQALKNILPALGNEFITIIKDSSLLQTIGVMELWNGAQSVVTATYLPITPLLFAAFYYLMVTTVLSFLLKKLENRMGNGGSN